MRKEFIDNYFRARLSADGIDPDESAHVYNCRPLTKTDPKTKVSVEYGFSVFLFGVLALRSVYKGKWSGYIEISQHCRKALGIDAELSQDGETARVEINDEEHEKNVLGEVYRYCMNNAKKELDCCSRFLECSDALECVNPCKSRGIVCGYRKKLKKGIVFYGKNRNI